MEEIKFKINANPSSDLSISLQELKKRTRAIKFKIDNRRLFIREDKRMIKAVTRSLVQNERELEKFIEEYTDLLTILTQYHD